MTIRNHVARQSKKHVAYEAVWLDIEDFLDLGRNPVCPKHGADRLRGIIDGHSSERFDDGWFGDDVSGPDDIFALLDHGWSKGADMVHQLAGEIQGDVEAVAPMSIRRALRRGPEGCDLDYEAFRQGDWDRAWSSKRRRTRPGSKNVTIVAQLSTSCRESAQEMFWKAAPALALADALEDAGYSARIVATESSYHYRSRRKTSGKIVELMTIKDFGEPMRMDFLAAALCHVGVFRLHWLHCALFAQTVDVCTITYGSPQSFGPEDFDDDLTTIGLDDPCVMLGRSKSRKQAVRTIKQALRELFTEEGSPLRSKEQEEIPC